jgi:amino acid adenylation domain-containing protein
VQTTAGGTVEVGLDPAVAARLDELARGAGITPFLLHLAGFLVLLQRYCGQDDLVVGTPVANRGRPELEPMIGLFVNLLVLRADLSGDPRFPELLARVREMALAAHAHQDLPFERLVEELGVRRDPARSPLFQALFVLQGPTHQGLALPGLRLRPLPDESPIAKYDLTLAVRPRGGRRGELVGAFEYNAELFDRATVRQLATHWRTLLAGIAAEPQERIGSLPMLTRGERHVALVETREDATPAPGTCVQRRVWEVAARAPGTVALVESGPARGPGGRAWTAGGSWTFAELQERARHLGRRLRRLGVGPEVRVASLCEPTADLVLSLLGILDAGGVYMPLDPADPPARQALVLRDSGARLVVCGAGLAERVTAEAPPVVALHAEDEDRASGSEQPPEPVDLSGLELAHVLYTSGSTGTPKGVAVPHQALLEHCWRAGAHYGLGPGDRVLELASPVFDPSLEQVLAPLLRGATVVLRGAEPWAPADLSRRVGALRLSVINVTPLYWQEWLRSLEDLVARGETGVLTGLSALRLVIVGGDVLPPAALALWRHLAGGPVPALAPVRLLNAYGPTEATVTALTETVGVRAGSPRAAVVGIGRPLPGRRAYVLDRDGRVAPWRVPGELHLGGCLARGYLGRPGLTAERFVPDPFAIEPGAVLYRTGDRVRRLPSGALEFLGRLDEQLKVRGARVELQEVQATLSRHPAVLECAVVGREAAPAPQGTRSAETGPAMLVAYFVAADPTADPAALERHCRERLPAFMVPAHFVALPAIPRNASGKVDRRALPAPAERAAGSLDELPGTPTEELVAGIWRELLGTELVRRSDGFFALGGHSLLATQLVSRLREGCGVELPLRAVFESPELAELARRVEEEMRSGTPPLPPVEPVGRERPPPLSFAQERLWLLDRLEGPSAAYSLPVALRLGGRLDAAALRRSFEGLVLRHEVLRTRFAESASGPVQVVAAPADFRLPCVDLRALGERGAARAAEAILGREAERPFDLEAGPLLRALLVRLAEEDHRLLVNLHHAVSDDGSARLLVRELAQGYAAHLAGAAQQLPPPVPQYGDFAVWQRRWLGAGAGESQAAYWRGQLTGAPQVLDLPTDRPRPRVQTFRGATHDFDLDGEIGAGVEALARSAGATPFMTGLAAFGLLLARLGGQREVLVGTPVANRRRRELESLVGLFVNTLVLRVDLRGEPTFRELLSRVRRTALAAYAHQDLPFERLVELMRPARSLGHSPLFQALFVWHGAPLDLPELPGLTVSQHPLPARSARFDLTLTLSAAGRSLAGSFEYNRDLFDATTIARFAGGLRTLLRAAAAAPERRVSELPLAEGVAARHVEREWNDTRRASTGAGGVAGVHEAIAAVAGRRGDRVAVVCGERQWTHATVQRRAGSLARRLRALGVGAEARVGLYLERSPEMVAAILGVLRAGAAYVPVDPGYPAERNRFVLRDAGAACLLVTPGLEPTLPAGLGIPLVFVGEDEDESLGRDAQPEPWPAVDPEQAAYVLYTSGSTGRPKGVVVAHRALLGFLRSMAERPGLGADDVLVAVTSLAFDIAGLELLLPLLAGGRVVIASRGEAADGERLAELIDRHRATALQATPATWRMLLAAGWPRDGRRTALAALCGGEALPRDLAAELAPRVAALWNLYGPTETTIWSAVERVAGDLAGQPDPVSIGRPIAETELLVLDDALGSMPVGVPGELYIGGAGLARGYLGRPALTAASFVPDPRPERPGARLYRTGDRARRLADGRLAFLGRRDQQLKVRGFRIEPGEIEAALRRHPGVAAAAVVMSRAAGEGRLVAFVVPAHPQDPPAAASLRQHLQGLVPDPMLPAGFAFLAELPLTPNGKLDRAALASAPVHAALPDAPRAAPRTATEALLVELWRPLLGLAEIGVDDDFFALGGHSLLAAQAVSALRRATGAELPLRALFESPTVAGLAARVDAARPSPPARQVVAIPRTPRGEELPLSSGQQRLWFLDRLQPGSAGYTLAAGLRLRGPLRAEALGWALAELVRRHEALRTRFEVGEDGRVRGRLDVPPADVLSVEDLAALPPSRREAWSLRRAHEEVRRGFDLSRSPLLRATLLRLDPADHLLVVAIPHIAADGWSLRILLGELQALYAAATTGAPAPPEPRLQQHDVAAWQRERLAPEVVEREVAHWRQRLAGLPPLTLPTDSPRDRERRFRGARRRLAVSTGTVAGMRRLAREADCTLFAVVVACLDVLLRHHAGQTDVAVGIDVARRDHPELAGVVGYLADQLVLRTSLAGNPTLRQLVGRVQQASLDAQEHQDLPFEVLVQELRQARDLAHTPLFEVKVAYQEGSGEPRMAGLEVEPVELFAGETKFDLTLFVEAERDRLDAILEYDADLFAAPAVDAMGAGLETLFAAAGTGGSTPIEELRVLLGGPVAGGELAPRPDVADGRAAVARSLEELLATRGGRSRAAADRGDRTATS